MNLTIGIDIGSTTVKVIVIENNDILFKHYERHFSQVREKTAEVLAQAAQVVGDRPFRTAISGSAGFGLAKRIDVDFIQEVFATGEAVKKSYPDTDVVIELGGEDAKILFLTGGVEERMNGTCAGGTGAFIDQMSTLLNVTPDELDRLSMDHQTIYPIASRCGVFAKSDIQPLLNQGARHEDIAASIYQAVVDQTITGLAQGRSIRGKVVFLGGPLYFSKGLQQRFVETLGLDQEHAIFPDLGQFAVAIGSAMYADKNSDLFTMDELLRRVQRATDTADTGKYLKPLFEDQAEYDAFQARHASATIASKSISSYQGDAYLGIDCGSTTTKLVLISEANEILYQFYHSNQGNPVDIVRAQLLELYKACGDRITIRGSAVTGYGEDLIKAAFTLDAGLVETMAHLKAAQLFCPQVDFILDIGGQDIKCFKIKNSSIDSIMLNEACSSGCGSFIETFARSLGYSIADFAKLGLFARLPVDLGSRCTVFMNSSVKQAQKDGALVEDISAGLSMSVVKNAIYKVIRAHSAAELGEHIVVQGGTFLNDAVLRSFERELGHDVIRPAIAGLMGAYGAALYAKSLRLDKSSLMPLEKVEGFTHISKSATCGLCANKCNLTVNLFDAGRKFISGNRCERPLGRQKAQELPNIYAFKRRRIQSLESKPGPRGKIGIPLGLNMFENIGFWHAFLTELGFEVVLSDMSSRELYTKGRCTIPSDTACYPAKLMHGHIMDLLEKGIDKIFYPCLSYNFDEHKGDNHFNCPVVAYYPELLMANMEVLNEDNFLYPFFGLHRRQHFVKSAYRYFSGRFADITREEIRRAADCAYAAYDRWQEEVRDEGKRALAYARAHGLKTVILAGRPYHIDSEINHGIDTLIGSFGIVVISEDCVADLVAPQQVQVLNQWTYHARLYNAAKYATMHDDVELVQLVSFGCGLDAITTDEVREILEGSGKLYTQLKIDEISNLGAVRIRIRSLLAAMEERSAQRAEQADV